MSVVKSGIWRRNDGDRNDAVERGQYGTEAERITDESCDCVAMLIRHNSLLCWSFTVHVDDLRGTMQGRHLQKVRGILS